jgi:Family of unknown function (DUF6011)
MTATAEHEHCLRPGCARRLYSAASRARGYGSGCWRRIRAAAKLEALAAFTGRQIEQARELIEDAALVPAAIAGYFFAVSTDGSELYTTSAEICSCLANKACYHQAAIIMATGKAA